MSYRPPITVRPSCSLASQEGARGAVAVFLWRFLGLWPRPVVGEVLREAKEGGQGRTVRSLTFHSLRHSFNSAMANAGVAQEIRMKLTGHTSADMNKGYTHLEMESLRAGISVLSNIAGLK